jgi:hypothetical protein
MVCPEWTAWKSEKERLLKRWEAAMRAWDRDNGPDEKTIAAGEELYFAGDDLIQHFECEPLQTQEA